MRRNYFRIVVLLLCCVSLSIPAAASAAPVAPESGVRVLASSSDGMVLDVQFPVPQLATESRAGTSYTVVTLGDELGVTTTPAQPQLPFRSQLVALPSGASVTLSVSNEQWETLPVPWPVLPAPRFVAANTVDSTDGAAVSQITTADPAVYDRDAWLPDSALRLGEQGKLRDQDLISLEIYPVRYNPVQGEIQVLRQAHVVLQFQGGQLPTTVRPDPYFEETLKAEVINYDAARAWRTPPAAPVLPAAPDTGDVRIAIQQTGAYKVTYEQLAGLGYDLSTLPVNYFSITNKGQAVARHVADNNDNGYLDPGEYVMFYGQALDMTYYTFDNIYWLKLADVTAGLRMTGRRARPSTATVPANFLTTRHIQDQKNWRWSQHMVPFMAWWWDQFQVNTPAGERTYSFSLPERAAVSAPVTLTVRLGSRDTWEIYNPEHHNRLYLNGSPIPFVDAFWDGRVIRDFSGTVNQSNLYSGSNDLRVQTVITDVGRPSNAQVDWTYFMWIEATYYRTYNAINQELSFGKETAGTWRYNLQGFSDPNVYVLEITDPFNPVRLTSGESAANTFSVQDATTPSQRFYAIAESALHAPVSVTRYTAAPVNLRDPAHQADYIVISHPDFMAAIQPLIDYRHSQGLSTILVDINWIYDQFNGGILDAEAIKTFTSYVYTSWTAPAPAYVLLVGGTDFNPHGYNQGTYGPVQTSYIPTVDLPIDPFQGESAADNYFAAVSGGDDLPDMYLGRFPVKSAATVTGIVNKIINYESNPERGAWQNDVLFVADDPDSAGNFVAIANGVISTYLANGNWDLPRVFYDPYNPSPVDPYYNTLTATRNAIRSKWNNGVVLANYIGHASIDYWGSTISDQFWHVDDIQTLNSGSRIPYLISLDCLDGYFDYPNRPSLAEKYLGRVGGGVIAHFAPSGLGIATGHDYLHRGFYQAIILNHQYQVGQIMLTAKLNLHNSIPNYYQDLIQTFGLFGDPATTLVPLCRTTDVNCDNQVNVVDVQTVAGHFGQSQGQPGFATRYDMNNDNTVNVLDILASATDYGWHQP